MKGNKKERVKKPINRELIIRIIILLVVLSVIFTIVSSLIFSKNLLANTNSEIVNVIRYVENQIDVDDLDTCIKTGETSSKYKQLQLFLNEVLEDFELEYLYIVIPKETVLVNVISATSEEEYARGEEDMLLLEETDAYSPAELKRFSSYWDTNEVNYFIESSDYGGFYTGIKALRNSKGETIALICVDKSIEYVFKLISFFVLGALIIIIVVSFSMAIFLFLWIRKNVTNPIEKLEFSTHTYADENIGNSIQSEIKYIKPDIDTNNEIQSLNDTIYDMTIEIQKRADEKVEAEKRAQIAENQYEVLSQEARTRKKIEDLTKSMKALLENMPSMTFSKDIETGKYVACNQAFAEYANKTSPEGVVGLTDFDLFDEETAKHFVEDDKKAYSMDGTYVLYEDVLDGQGNKRQFQTTKFKFTDDEGKDRLLGMSVDITEMERIKAETIQAKEAYEEARSEIVTYSNIAKALSMDYAYIYYVSLITDQFIEYSSDITKEDLAIERRGNDFFAQSRKDAMLLLHKDDQQQFVNAFYKENIVDKIDKNGSFTLTYRLLVENKPSYVSMKITRMRNDPNHLIIGVNSVEAQMKYQEAMERIKEERLTYSRITALSGDYICIYTVNPNTDDYVQYSATHDYQQLGLDVSGTDFFNKSIKDSVSIVYYEDIERFKASFTKEKVLSSIKEKGLFVLNYRIIKNNVPIYLSLKAAMIEEKDGPQLIVGIINIDEQVKKEQEYAYKLEIERNKANIDALTGVKNKHAYVDEELKLNKDIEDKKEVEFAIIVFDVNGLKRVNDTHGHNAGDQLIKDASSIICNVFKHSPVYRIGGDEFTVIAQGEDYMNIHALLDEVSKINMDNTRNNGVVIACGMSKYQGDRSVSSVFERADSLMYNNKNYLKRIKK